MSEQDLENQIPEGFVSKDEVEEAARQQGWDPDKGELNALEFLAKGRDFRQRILKNERKTAEELGWDRESGEMPMDFILKKFEDLQQDNQRVYGIVAEHIMSQKQKEASNERTSIEAQIREAADNGETDKVIELTRKLQEVEDPKKEEEYDPVTQAWIKENPWFQSDKDMAADAMAVYQAEITKNNGVDPGPNVVLPKITEKIERLYPDYFKASNPNRNRDTGAETRSTKTAKSKDGISMNDLDEDEKRHVEDFVKMGMKEDRILESIQNARKQRGR